MHPVPMHHVARRHCARMHHIPHPRHEDGHQVQNGQKNKPEAKKPAEQRKQSVRLGRSEQDKKGYDQEERDMRDDEKNHGMTSL